MTEGPALPLGRFPSDRLTTWQVVRQSHAIHPDWDVATHLAFLGQEGYDLRVFSFRIREAKPSTPTSVVTRWLAEMDRLPPLEPAP